MILTVVIVALVGVSCLEAEGIHVKELSQIRTRTRRQSLEELLRGVSTEKSGYVIVAPRVVRPGLPYPISVSLYGNPWSVWGSGARDNILLAEIREHGSNNAAALTWVTNVMPGHPITVPISGVSGKALEPGRSYKLFVKAATRAGRVLFQAEENVSINSKSLSVFVQTDKAVYKPSSIVKYRIVVITPELQAYSGNVTTQIRDPNGNVIKLHRNETLRSGVVSKDLELASEPPLGDWAIHVDTGLHYSFTKTFTVAKYVLPKFEVTVEAPSYTTVPDDVTLKIKARYTFGKGVEGTVTLRPKNTDTTPAGPIEKTIHLDKEGQAEVKFSFLELFRRNLIDGHSNDTTVEFLATATEELTGIQRNGTGSALIFKHGIKIGIHRPTTFFKPGLDYRLLIAVTTPAGDPIPETYSRSARLKIISYNKSTNKTEEEIRTLTLEEDGTVQTILRPNLTTKWTRVEVHYDRNSNLDSPEYFEKTVIYPATSPSDTYLQVEAGQDSAYQPGDRAVFTLTATQKLKDIAVQVIARGDLVLTKQIAELSDGASGYNLSSVSFPVTADMAPKSRIVVYAVRTENDEILVDALDFKVTGFFKNNVSLKFSQERAQPGETVEVSVQTTPQSFVGLMAVDESVRLLKSGNDITYDLVEKDIEQYGLTGQTGGNDAQSVFQNAGLVVLTNGNLYDYEEEQRKKALALLTGRESVFPSMRGGGGRGRVSAAGFAGFGAFDGAPPPRPFAPGSLALESGGSPSPRPRLRHTFPETWIWLDGVAGADGNLVHRAEVPDTITSWVASVFSISNEHGFAVSKSTSKLEVFRPFFIRPELPYSVKRNENLALKVLVFNYLDEDQTVTVTLEHSDSSGFHFLSEDGSLVEAGSSGPNYNKRRITLEKEGGSGSVSFPIRASKVGDLRLKMRGLADAAGDAVERFLLVEPEGIRVEKTAPMIMDLSVEGNAFSESVSMDFPGAIEGSQKAQVSVIGDVMGSVLDNLENLVRMPSGCGEQNMIHFVPNIVVLRYLNVTGRLTEEVEAKAKRFMELGYQRELSYMRYDDSFSAFGNKDVYGSTWLTAFVLRSFHQARPYIHIDLGILDKAARFLDRQQNSSTGAFAERGEVHNKALQGGAREGGAALTAYVVISLLRHREGYKYEEWKRDSISRAVNYLNEKLDAISEDVYALSITTYALHLAGSPLKDRALRMLEDKAMDVEKLKHWEVKVKREEDVGRSLLYSGPRAPDVEASSYALLTYVEREDILDGVPVLRWLTTQRNSNGGYSSTQDTVLAIQAMGAFAEKAYSPNFDIDVQIKNGQKIQRYNISPENAIVLNIYEVPDVETPVKVEASGKGMAFAQVSWSYHTLPELQRDSPFNCTQDVRKVGGSLGRIEVSTCCNYKLEGQTNMALVEFEALSGHQIDGEELEKLTDIPDFQRVDLEKGGTAANIYMNKMTNKTVCFKVVSDKVYSVANQAPATFTLLDYYSPEKRLMGQYSVEGPSLNDICPDCWKNIPST